MDTRPVTLPRCGGLAMSASAKVLLPTRRKTRSISQLRPQFVPLRAASGVRRISSRRAVAGRHTSQRFVKHNGADDESAPLGIERPNRKAG